MVRSSQPMVGMSGRRSELDESYVQLLARSGGVESRRLYILDARSKINSMGNLAMGRGTENGGDYGATVCYFDIDNIHVLREAYNKLAELCQPTGVRVDEGGTYWSRLNDSGWMKQVSRVLIAGVRMAEILEIEGVSCLTHCSDGWDRTAQMCALAELLMDPFYRTLQGFAVLIEKEWCAFGHKFAHRTAKDGHPQRSPVFLLWLDVVWQVMRQFPTAFQFSADALIVIMDHLYSSRFGTFLYNCEKHRAEKRVRRSTSSLWTFLLAHSEDLRNADYELCEETLWPSCDPRSLALWEAYFYRYNSTIKPAIATVQMY
eukprot:PLAT6423.1.p2 GENE.PLAT6423.1~~PLAT6423.1.p2  ORF type:complete len:324 (+),score=171.51 PLAT6423.1:24-974(+)